MRKSLPKKLQLQVWKRDGWTCRYCSSPVFFAPTLKLLEGKSPGHGYWHSNGKTGKMLGLFQMGWASVDHIIPVAKGGNDDLDNLVTACWKCNLNYKDKSVGEGKSEPTADNKKVKDVNWDGFSSLYPKLSEEKDEWCSLINSYQ